jgi:hypothetical protein
MAAERAAEARREADQLACKAWSMRMLGYKGHADPRAGALYALGKTMVMWGAEKEDKAGVVPLPVHCTVPHISPLYMPLCRLN